jgi:hypothetical protein
MASGGLLYHDPQTHEWYDTVDGVYDYATGLGPARRSTRRRPPTAARVLRELHGRSGTLLISESEVKLPGVSIATERTGLGRVDQQGYVSAPRSGAKEKVEGAVADVRESARPTSTTVPVSLRDPYHQPHLQNFFDAVRGKAR